MVLPDPDELPLPFADPIQQRYEIIRPVVVLQNRSVSERAQETGLHPETVGRFTRRFQQHGMRGLFPGTVEVRPAHRRRRVPDAVIQELQRLKGLYTGFGYRELARIVFHCVAYRIDHKTVKQLWEDLPPAAPLPLPVLDYHSYADPAAARLAVIQLYAHGWSKTSISHFLHVSRPTIHAWIRRFERDTTASLADQSSAPHAPRRKVWLPVMVEIYHLQKRHPDAGGFRIWSLWGKTDLSVRTIERIMALNRTVYNDIPHTAAPRKPAPAPQPHPFKATAAHEYWFIDGRMMDFALDGVRWWSLLILDGYSRMIVAGAVAPSEASWVALLVLYTACQRYGIPRTLISDSGGAFVATAFEAVCRRLGIAHTTIVSTAGESYMNLIETHFNIQRRVYDYQFSLTRTPMEFEQAHQRFIHLYNTTAHQGLLKELFTPPIPQAVLGAALGQRVTPDELQRKFAQALFLRTTNPYGCVTLHRSHFYVEAGLPTTPVLLWVDGEAVRAVYDNVVVAEYHCRYDRRVQKVVNIHTGYFHHTRFASSQEMLLPRSAAERVILLPPHRPMPQACPPSPAQQLGLFEWINTA